MARIKNGAMGDILDFQLPAVAERPTVAIEGNTLGSQVARAIKAALDDCLQSRAQIAELMSKRLGTPIGKATLDAYAAEGKPHTIPLDRFIALIEVTGRRDLVGFVADRVGMIAVDQRYEALIGLQLIREHQEQIDRKKKALELRWKASS
jgi:hypothetical protein